MLIEISKKPKVVENFVKEVNTASGYPRWRIFNKTKIGCDSFQLEQEVHRAKERGCNLSVLKRCAIKTNAEMSRIWKESFKWDGKSYIKHVSI